MVGYIRQDIEDNKESLTEKEYCILIATLIYNIDRLANTVGHFEAYIKKPIKHQPLKLRMIEAESYDNIAIFNKTPIYLQKVSPLILLISTHPIIPGNIVDFTMFMKHW